MIKNYWTIFIRSFKLYKLSNILSILSVSISMGVGIMLLSNINGHFQADTFHPNIENTYRVITRVSDKNSERHYATTPEFIADSLTKHSSIRNICTFSQAGVRDVEAKFGKVDLQIAQTTPTFFEMFGFKVTPESAASSINGGTSVLLTNEASEKIFGKEQALGKVVQIDQFGQFIVGGVIRKPRLASHLKFDALISLPIRTTTSDSLSQKNDIYESYNYTASSIYVTVNQGTPIQALNKILEKIQIFQDLSENRQINFYAQNIDDITPWNPKIENDYNAGLNWKGINTMLFLAFLTILLSATNYTSLSIAKITQRQKEIGIRKIFGAFNRNIFSQLLFESTIFSLLTFLLTFPVLVVTKYFFGISLTGTESFHLSSSYILMLFLYCSISGLVAGAIPALITSNIKVLDIIQEYKRGVRGGRINIKGIILVTQFSISLIFIAFAISFRTSQEQTRRKALESLPSNLFIVQPKNSNNNSQIFVNILKTNSLVEAVSTTQYMPTNATTKSTIRIFDIEHNKDVQINTALVDKNFIDVFGLSITQGRNFSESTSARSVLINEAAAKKIFYEDFKNNSVIGKLIKSDSSFYEVIGIVSDASFHTRTVNPLIFIQEKGEPLDLIAIRTTQKTNSQNLKQVLLSTSEFEEVDIYNYKNRLSEQFDESLSNINSILNIMIIIILLVSCIGLFGISDLHVEKAKRNSAIMKVLGASNMQILASTSWPLIRWIVISIAIGIPLSIIAITTIGKQIDPDISVRPINIFYGCSIVLIIALTTIIVQILSSVNTSTAETLRRN